MKRAPAHTGGRPCADAIARVGNLLRVSRARSRFRVVSRRRALPRAPHLSLTFVFLETAWADTGHSLRCPRAAVQGAHSDTSGSGVGHDLMCDQGSQLCRVSFCAELPFVTSAAKVGSRPPLRTCRERDKNVATGANDRKAERSVNPRGVQRRAKGLCGSQRREATEAGELSLGFVTAPSPATAASFDRRSIDPYKMHRRVSMGLMRNAVSALSPGKGDPRA